MFIYLFIYLLFIYLDSSFSGHKGFLREGKPLFSLFTLYVMPLYFREDYILHGASMADPVWQHQPHHQAI